MNFAQGVKKESIDKPPPKKRGPKPKPKPPKGPDGRKNKKDYSDDPDHLKPHHDAHDGCEIIRAEGLKEKDVSERIQQAKNSLKGSKKKKEVKMLENDPDLAYYLTNKWKKGKGGRGRPKGATAANTAKARQLHAAMPNQLGEAFRPRTNNSLR